MKVLAALALIALGAAPQQDPFAPSRAIVADLGKVVTPRGVQETFELTLGGARQVVNVRGADRANPLLIFVHGGPGSVEMPIAWTFQRGWEDYFTVVQWDQRGAGRSYPLNDPAKLAPTMTLARYRDDTIELIDALNRRYGKRKVVLVGHSWGSMVGLSAAIARPDLLHAYVGIGQAVDFREGDRVGMAWTLAEAKRRGDAKAVRAIEALAPYPDGDSFTIANGDAWRAHALRYGALAAYRDNAQYYFDVAKLSPEYTAADRRAWQQGSEFSVKTLWPRLARESLRDVRAVKVPIVFLLGRHDRFVPAPLAADWLARVRAPSKRVVWFEHSAHLPMIEEPGRTLTALVEHVRPLAKD